jgi:hypothetical protein
VDVKCKWVSTFNQPFVLDSLSVVAESIYTPVDSTVQLSYDYSTGAVTIKSSDYDSLEVCYQVIPFAFHRSYARRTLQEYDSSAFFKVKPMATGWVDTREELFTTDQLYKSGSISRGISFGNNQDVFVNSNLNLQMEGKLTHDVNISAVITDQNIPFQPEGNTQQLQDFDKVLVNLYNDKFSLSAGDVVLQHQGYQKGESYFLQYYKNVQGGLLRTNYELLDAKASTGLGVSVAKGKFASIQLESLEGVQGPYKVQGPNNERFVVILAGSEKVFIDGKLLTRGYNYDYVIDYNLGEITFTNRVLITKYTRIRVDFEFSDQNYSKSILTASHEQQWKKTKIFVNAYSEKDNENRPLAFQLSNEDKRNLSQIGDELDKAVISGIDSVGYTENQVLYKMVDTLDATGMPRSILIFSNHPDSAHYNARFTQVGFGKGEYIQSNNTLNGRVYQWAGVDQDGVPLGDFVPDIKVITPQKKQMLTVGLVHDLSAEDYVFAEAAFSARDLNLYSDLDDEDNLGRAIKVGLVRTNKAFAGGRYFFSGSLTYEYTSRFFNPIDRFRYIEFDRDWSLSNEDLSVSEEDNILNFDLEVKKDQDNLLKYKMVRRKRGQMADGFQHQFLLAKSLGKFQFRSDVYKMNSDQLGNRSDWLRWTLDTYYQSKWLVPGYRYQVDRNEISATSNDSIVGSAMHYAAHNFYLRSSDSAKTRFMADLTLREDQLPQQGKIVPEDKSRTFRLGLGTDIGANQRLDLLFTYRKLQNLRTVDVTQDEENITTRLDWQGNFLDRHIIGELNYQAGNSRELKRDFVFIQVPTGEGTHTWRDENDDGIQDLNEFYLAINPDERNYAKIFLPTDEYVLAFGNTLNFRLNLEMPRHWRNNPGIKGLLSRFSSQTSLNIQRKLTDDNINQRFSPFAKNIEDNDLIASKEQFRSTWFFNRSNAKFGFDFGVLRLKNKQLLMDGFEARDMSENHLSIRYSPQKAFMMRLLSARKTKKLTSDFLESRNYTIREQALSPEIAWQPTNHFRISTKYSMADRKNIFTEGDGEMARVRAFSLDLRHSKVQRSTLNANITFTNIDFQGQVNTAVGYELLQALQPGNNILWSANWQFKIAAGLQLQVQYDGRKSPDVGMVHTGRMQVNALF